MQSIEDQMPLVEVHVSEAKPVSSSRKYVALIASTVSLALIVLGFSFNTHPAVKTVSTQFRSLLEKTIAGEAMPVPFWIIRQDVPNPLKVQDAFYNFYTLRDQTASMVKGDVKYTTTFFESVKMETDGKSTVLGYFNPTSPKGLSSNKFRFEYGEKCEETKDYREGQLTLTCGEKLEIISVSEIKPCRYEVVATAPEQCSGKATYSFLKGTSVEAADNSWWNFKINFWKHSDSASPIYQFHSDGAHSERFLLGTMTNKLGSDKSVSFTNGDVCEPTGKHREGVIHVECGCDYEIASFTEPSVCVYDIVVKHPKACTYVPSNCNKLNLRESLISKKRAALHIDNPDWNQLYSTRMDASAFPRDLLNTEYKL